MNLDLTKVINGLQDQLEFNFDLILSESYLESIKSVDASVINVFGKIKKIGKRYDLTLTYSGDMIFECHRCLERVTISLKNTVERLLVTKLDTEGSDEETLLESSVLDLAPILEEEITLNLPLQVICSENCKGLCPRCGTDLNKETCTCSDERIDPRLEALKNLFT